MVEQDAKGQVRAVDMVILDEGKGVIPLWGLSADSPPFKYAIGALSYESVWISRR